MRIFKLLQILSTITVICLLPANASKILGVFAFPSKSHFMIIKTVMGELAKRGHEVTVISCFHQEEDIPNYKEVLISPTYDFWKDMKTHLQIKNIFGLADMSMGTSIKMMNLMGLGPVEHALKHSDVQKIIHDTEHQYDLLIVEQYYQDAFLMLAHKYDVPIVALTAFGFENILSGIMGQITPWALSPHSSTSYSDKMTFFERLRNTYWSLYTELNWRFAHLSNQNALAHKYFSHLPGPLPSISDLHKNISVILMNNYVPLDMPRANVMGLVPVGGVHIKPPKTLLRDIRSFLDSARHGAILFSLGTNIDSSELPPEKVEVFLKVFSKLKEHVLWKWSDEKMPNLPKNVMIKKWIHQNDVLAHPHVKLFITHGGLLSMQEAVYRSVPVLGIPIYGIQFLHMKKAVSEGYGVSLDFHNITEISLTWALQKLLYDPSYMIEMRKASQIFRDRQIGALETSMYWIEYVLRYKGASHIKTAAIYLSWYSLYLLDVIAYICAVIFAFFICIYLMFKLLKHFKGRKKAKVYYKLN